MLRLYVSTGNTKIGSTPNVSLLPVLTCGKTVPCRQKCYALKGCRAYSGVIPAWAANTLLWSTDPDKFWAQLTTWFAAKKKPPKFFRWFVGGDIPDTDFLEGMKVFAARHPQTAFLAFTKRGFAVQTPAADLPPNLTLWFSAWPGWGYEKLQAAQANGYPVAWYHPKNGADLFMPNTSVECPGKCDKCRMCWSKKTRNVFFFEH